MMGRMSTAKILAMADRNVGDMKKKLLSRARYVENNSPEPRHTIHMWDMNLAMKEKERLGINFNRSVTMSLESRWEVVNKLTVEFLKEVISLNDQLSEEANKHAKQLLTLILTRAKRLGMVSRMEQMAGLLMHITFYRTVLKAKVEEMQEVTSFLFQCAELMGFTHPTQIMNRYTALKATLNEIREDFEVRVQYLSHLQEKQTEFLEFSSEQNIVLYNKMASMHLRLKDLRSEIVEMERFIEEKEYQACDSMIKLRQIKASIQHCYSSIMAYKGLEGRETNLVKQMEEFGIRLGITMAAIKYVEDEKARNAKDMERHDSGRLPMGRHSCDTGVGSGHGEGDDNSHSVQMGGAASETNRSSNWRPEQAGGCDAAQKFHSRTKRFRQRGGGMSSCGEDTGLVISECSIPTIYDSAKAIHSSTEQNKRTELPPRSTVDDRDCRGRCQRRGCFARSRSFSIEENEAMKPRKGNGLETIREGGCRDTKRAHSTRASSSVSRSPQRVHYPPRPTPNSAASNASIDISFNKSLPDQEFQVSKSGDTKALKHRSRDKYFLPSINPDSAKVSKRNASSTLCCLSENSEMKSGERLLSLSRVSDRVRNQMNSAQRLYYLSSAPEQQFRTLSNGYWEDGVFVPVPQGNTRQRKRSSKSSTVPVKEKTVDQVSKSDLKLEEKEKGEDGDNCKTNKSQLPILQVPFKVAVKRFSTSTETLSLKDIDVLQRVISRSGHERQTLDATKELQGYPLDTSKSSATTVDCLQRQPLQTQKSDRDLTSPTRKPSLAKKSSSCKILAKYCSAPVKSLYPPLRQPSIIRQKWRLADEKSSQSPPGRVEAAAHSLNAQKYWTDMYQTQNFKRDCLSILANVKLGSRLP